MTDWAVEIEQVGKRFGDLEVLRAVDARVARGRVTAILGPNAAGKSTLIKIVLGLCRADGGRVTVAGSHVNGAVSYRSAIGYMPQAPHFPGNLRGWEVLRLVRDLRPAGEVTDEELLEQFGLAAELDKPVRILSGGTRQKLNAVIAFLFRPALLILDEPTAGLDPVASGLLKEKIGQVRAAGRSIILTSHVLSEVEELADDVILLLEGRVRFAGSLPALRSESGESRLERAVAWLMRREDPGAGAG